MSALRSHWLACENIKCSIIRWSYKTRRSASSLCRHVNNGMDCSLVLLSGGSYTDSSTGNVSMCSVSEWGKKSANSDLLIHIYVCTHTHIYIHFPMYYCFINTLYWIFFVLNWCASEKSDSASDSLSVLMGLKCSKPTPNHIIQWGDYQFRHTVVLT